MEFVTAKRSSPTQALTLVLMHGLGSNEKDMAGLAEMLDERVEVICIRAPIQYNSGFAWFDIQWTLQGILVDETQVWRQVDEVAEFLDVLGSQNLVIGGFSQGAMMALGLITKRPDLVIGGLFLSGRGLNAPIPEFAGQIFHAHGLFDDVISIEESRMLRTLLVGLGDKYEYHEYEMGHWVDEDELRDINGWLAKLI